MKNKWETASSLFACPLCGTQMSVSNSSMVCENNHCYDISKKGYINFVQKGPVKIYNAELFENRHFVLGSGFYDKMIDTMDDLVNAHIYPKDNYTVMDAGCGEGTFLAKLCSRLPCNKIGIDISKDAILQASKHSKEILWLVADLVNIPLKDHGIDILFNIFTPANYQSFHRILKDDGIMIKAIPGAEYLKEFRDAAGAKLQKREDDEEQIIRHLSQYMKIAEKKKVHYQVNVNMEQLMSWIRMTPMMANVSLTEKNLSSIDHVTIDVILCVCQKSEVFTKPLH
ncbi:MAG: methyltransferase domain-containing protein [Candidatus Gastranaerophilales bacterium]|nr:methyltransferase domain-containing protein [Candidatus Gastranaerophilales bacterium]